MRRVLTFQRGLTKLMGPNVVSEGLHAQLCQEWDAICAAKGYPPCFKRWVLRVACFSRFPLGLSEPEWVADLLQHLQFDCLGLVRQQAKERKALFKYRVQLDIADGHSREGYRAIKPPALPPFLEVPCHKKVQVQPAEPPPDVSSDESNNWFLLERPCCLHVPGPASLAGKQCQVLECCDNLVRVEGVEATDHGALSQEYVATTPEELHDAFVDFWGPLWQRDSVLESSRISEWPSVLARLQADGFVTPQLHVRSFAPDLWMQAIKRMSARKATGICGWAPSDLKLLPLEAVEVLAGIFHQAVTCGLPAELLKSRVSVLAKAELPTSIKQSRPITIFSTLYRIWSSVLTRQILDQWSAFFPASVSGSMPGRSCRDTSYRQQHLVELSLLSSSPRIGCSVDIIKCFNQLGWPVVAAMLIRLGVPEPEVRFWVHCQRQHRRHTNFHGSLSQGIPSSNGAPEGDPFSVATMAAVCFWAQRWCGHAQVDFDTYVDNWAWASGSRQALRLTLESSLVLLQDLSLPVDTGKSYLWATKRRDRLWWRAIVEDLFSGPDLPTLVSEVKDLGVAFKFDARGHRQHRNNRLSDGLSRLDRLGTQPRPPLNKARLVQTAVWPACLFGAEGHVHSLSDLQLLRGRAARAVVGPYKVLSPFLTFAVLASTAQDPAVYCLQQQLLAFRRCCLMDPDLALSILQVATSAKPTVTAQGPATALRIALDRVGLVLTDAGVLKGLDNTRVSLYECSTGALRDLLQRSWAIHVQGQVDHRNGLHFASPLLPHLTAKMLSKHTGPEQSVLLRHITGAFSSEASKSLWDTESNGQCALCGLKQTKEHKLLECPALADVRGPWMQHIQFAVKQWPHWIHCPAAVYPPDLEVPQLVFHTRSLPNPRVDFTPWPVPAPRGYLRIYTDGSCANPSVPLASHAGFAVVLDTTSVDEEIPTVLDNWRRTSQLPGHFAVICQGLVPGGSVY